MVNILGIIDIPIQDIFFLLIAFFFIGRWYVTRLVTSHKVKILLIDKTGLEGRIFPAEESLEENRVSLIKRKSYRNTEKLDFQKAAGPLNIYTGSKREVLYKSTEGFGKTTRFSKKTKKWDGATESWKDTEESDTAPSLVYEETSKLRTLLNVLNTVAMKNTWEKLTWLFMGLLIGIILSMVLPMIFQLGGDAVISE